MVWARRYCTVLGASHERGAFASLVTHGLVAIALLGGGTAWAASYPDHRGSSPWSFDAIAPPSDVYVVNDTDGSTIDRYMFRNQGDIVIDIPIRRYVGPTDGQGYLQNAHELIERGVVSSTFSVTMPAFDVDTGVFPTFDCDGDNIPDQLYDEVNEVYLNDEKLGQLRGQNNIWFQNSFNLPITKLRFPSAPGEVAINRVRVEIDVANRDVVLSSGARGCIVWATEIDWVGIRFQAASPVALVHGIRSNGAVWGNFRAGLESRFVIPDNSITLDDPPKPDELPLDCGPHPYNDTMPFNIAQLRKHLPAIARRFGSGSLHVVGHSKGGLDTRGLLSEMIADPIEVEVGRMGGQPVTVDLEVRSLVTLNTPHGGSVLARYGVEARQLTTLQVARSSDRLLLTGVRKLEGPYYCDLTPARASAFVAGTLVPNETRAASVGTDADVDGNGRINGDEGEGFSVNYVANLLYSLLGNTAEAVIDVVPSGSMFFPDRVAIAQTPTGQFLRNDIIVTQDSALHYSAYDINGHNHLNVHSLDTATRIADDAQNDGLVNWRLK